MHPATTAASTRSPASHRLNPSIVVLAIALCVVIHYVARNAKSDGTRRLPPQACGAWPIVGHLNIFSGSKLPHAALGKMADKFGPIFTIKIGVHRVLIVSNWKLIEELSTIHESLNILGERLSVSAGTVSFLDAIRWVMGKACALLSCGLWKGLEVHVDITSNDYNFGYGHVKLASFYYWRAEIFLTEFPIFHKAWCCLL